MSPAAESGLRPGHPCGVPPPLRGGSPSPLLSCLAVGQTNLYVARQCRAVATPTIAPQSAVAGLHSPPKTGFAGKGEASARALTALSVELPPQTPETGATGF